MKREARCLGYLIFFFLIHSVLFFPLNAAAEQRIALVIGNSAYNSGPLKNPVNDATDMAALLRRLGFQVNLKQNSGLEAMEQAMEEFGNRLKRGGVGIFYYAGHGVQINGVNYLIPVDAKINKESDVRFKALDVGRILAEMENANNGLNIVLLDACRDNPFVKSFRNASMGLAIVSNAPTGTFISYSTGAGQVAQDGKGRNSPYTEALLQYMQEPGIPITDVFMKVRQKLRKETGQIPWELSSLEGKFFFIPDADKLTQAATAAELDDEKKHLSPGKPQSAFASSATATEIKRDGSYIAYGDGTVLDTQTNLMWAARDNGSGINWSNAKRYCENYTGGGYSDWRMPTQDELAGLFNLAKTYVSDCGRATHLTELIHLTCSALWSSEILGSTAAIFGFEPGRRYWSPQTRDNGTRALPVRSAR